MNRFNEKKHHVDIVFALGLFCMFALTAVLLVVIGGNVYKNTISNMEKNYDVRTSMAYITQKIRQNDGKDVFTVKNEKEGNQFVIKQNVGEQKYETIIYKYDGNLCEIVVKEGDKFMPEGGQKLLKIDDFDVQNEGNGLYKFTIDGPKDEPATFFVSVNSN